MTYFWWHNLNDVI